MRKRALLPLAVELGSFNSDTDASDSFAAQITSTPLPPNVATPGADIISGADGIGPANWPKGEPFVCQSWDDKSETTMSFNGSTWTITKKDIASGKIERFLQSGTSDHGRVEIIQGKPEAHAGDALHRNLFQWSGTEDKGPVKIAHDAAPLPRDMRRDVAGIILSAPNPMGRAFEGLLPPSVRQEMAQETHALVNSLNAQHPVSGTKANFLHAKPS